MAIVNGYALLTELKAYLDIQDADDDAMLELRIDAASRQIDGWCGRVFYTETATRTVTTDLPDVVFLADDLISIDTLATDEDRDRVYEVTWDATDYALDPPFRIDAIDGRRFPTGRLGVQITGTWGYANEVPQAIIEATLLQATRLYKRKDAPFGIAGSVELGQLQVIGNIDPDVKQLIAPFRKFAAVGV